MIVALTGTPGIGKTSVANILKKNGYEILDINSVTKNGDFVIDIDEKRDSKIINIKALNNYVEEKYSDNDFVFLDGHLSHLLNCVEKIILLRCHPDELRKRLEKKGWKEEKIKENIQAEILDVILCEAAKLHSNTNIFEIDTTNISIDEVVSIIIEITRDRFKNMKKYNIGNIDWSEEILKDF